MLTFERAASLLSYSPETGQIIWIDSPAKWIPSETEAGSIHRATGYRHVAVGQTKYRAHRLAWLLHHGEWPKRHIDHINGDRLDNRLVNLRLATVAENMQNRALDKRSKSGLTGVSWDKGTQKWRAKICIDRKQIHLGVFDSPELAAAAYAAAKLKHHAFQPIRR